MSAEQPIEAGGQRWHLVAFPTAEYMQSLQTRQPLLLGATAALAWELLVGLVFVIGKHSRDHLEQRHARLMNNILESLNEGVIVADRKGRILFANHVAAAVSGTARSDVSPSEWSEQHGFFIPGTDQPFPPDELPLARAIRGETVDYVELQVRNPQVPDGIQVSVRGGPMLNGRGQVRGGVVVFETLQSAKKQKSTCCGCRVRSSRPPTRCSLLTYEEPLSTSTRPSRTPPATRAPKSSAATRKPVEVRAAKPRILPRTVVDDSRGEPFGADGQPQESGEFYHAEQTITGIKDRNGGITHFVSVIKDMTERRKLQEQEIEMEFAAKVQRELFPAAPPLLPGYDLAGAAFPAQATSGDYFDFIRFERRSGDCRRGRHGSRHRPGPGHGRSAGIPSLAVPRDR